MKFRDVPDSIRMRIKRSNYRGCWVWTGAISTGRRGGVYPKISWKGVTWRVHRLLYTIAKGAIPDKYHIDHICKNTLCIRPAHLEAVPWYINIARSNGRCSAKMRERISNGHSYE